MAAHIVKGEGIYIQFCGRGRLDNRRKLKSENHKRRNYMEGPVGDSMILTLQRLGQSVIVFKDLRTSQ
jgi:hypothetical protein